MLKQLLGSIGGLLGIGGEYLKGKREYKKALLDGKIAVTKAKTNSEVKMIENESNHNYSLDKQSQVNMKRTYKDEYLLFLFTFPLLIACIAPFIVCYSLGYDKLLEKTIESFQMLDTLPDWLKYSIMGIVIVTFGLRGIFLSVFNKKEILQKEINPK